MGKRVWKVMGWILVASIIFGGGFIYGTVRTTRILFFATDPDGEIMPLRTQVLVSRLSDLRNGEVDKVRKEMESELTNNVVTMAKNPMWPSKGRAMRERSLGWAKLYYAKYPPPDSSTAVLLKEALETYSTAECTSGACWVSLRRLATTGRSATQPSVTAASQPALLQ